MVMTDVAQEIQEDIHQDSVSKPREMIILITSFVPSRI